MRIDKTIKGEKFSYYVQFVHEQMIANVRYFQTDEWVSCKISDDFEYILLPDSFLSPYISNVGYVPVGRLKLSKEHQWEAKNSNLKFSKIISETVAR